MSRKKQLKPHQQWAFYRTDEMDAQLFHQHIRASEQLGIPVEMNIADWIHVLDGFGHRCAISEKPSHHLSVDHFIPRSIGGPLSMGNCYPLDSALNSSKGDRNPFEWAKHHPDVNQALFEELVCYLASENHLSRLEFERYVYWCFQFRRTGILAWRQYEKEQKCMKEACVLLQIQWNVTMEGLCDFVSFCGSQNRMLSAESYTEWLLSKEGE